MSLHSGFPVRPNRPVAVEFAVVAAVLAVVYLWERLVRLVADPLSAALGPAPAFGWLPVGGLATGGLFLAGLALFARTYASARAIDVGLARPTRAALPLVGLAAATPATLVGVTALAGALTGVPYSSLSMTYYGGGPTAPVLAVVGLGLLVGVPALVITCQVLVQGSLDLAVEGDRAVVLTTLATGFAMTSHSGLATAPDPGKLVGAVLFVLVFGAAVLATERIDRSRRRRLAWLPVALFVAFVVGSGVAELDSLAGGLFAVAHLGTLGVAAYTYERGDSLLLPALAYLSLSLATTAVVLGLEAGGAPPF